MDQYSLLTKSLTLCWLYLSTFNILKFSKIDSIPIIGILTIYILLNIPSIN